MTAFRTQLRLALHVAGYVTGVSSLAAKTRRALKRTANTYRLAQLSDRQLADVGVARKDIAARAAEASAAAVPAAKSLIGQFAEWRAQQVKRVATHRLLSRLHERMLSDIGIEPDQLRAVSGTMVSTSTKIREAARFLAQPVIDFTNAAKLAELDFAVGAAANQDQAGREAA